MEFLIVLMVLALVTLFVTRPLWRVRNGGPSRARPAADASRFPSNQRRPDGSRALNQRLWTCSTNRPPGRRTRQASGRASSS